MSNLLLVFHRGICRRRFRVFLGFRGSLGCDAVDGDGNGFWQREGDARVLGLARGWRFGDGRFRQSNGRV